MNEASFLGHLRALVDGPGELSRGERITAARRLLDELADEAQAGAAELVIVPFEASRRPIDEGLHPGYGASEEIGLLGGEGGGDQIWLLYRLHGVAALAPERVSIRMSAWFLPHQEGAAERQVPGLRAVPVPLQRVAAAAYPLPAIEAATLADADAHAFVALVDPRGLAASGDDDPFTLFDHFHQRVRVELALVIDDAVASRGSQNLEVFDTGRFGSLYERLIALVARDTRTQAEALGLGEVDPSYHPWFPVLSIGTEKANLYMQGIARDVRGQQKNLPDARWLLRVGLYLELLTCFGVFEAVKDEHPDLLSPAERAAFEGAPIFAEIRARIDVDAWREVWALRPVAPRGAGYFSAGPVSLMNLMRKQRATLAFLHAHHEDLQHAIELAGANLHHSQETWHRVFRDAERAVLRNALLSFPELRSLSASQREFAFWHRKGFRGGLVPEWLTGVFGDQDGIYASACKQYRASMNHVAGRARERGLMDFTGDECITTRASLLEATMAGDQATLELLQRRDGYGPTLELTIRAPSDRVASFAEIDALLARVPIFAPLMPSERQALARRARFVSHLPQDRVVVQGQRGSSLFVVSEGEVEVLVRQHDGRDLAAGTLGPGAVFGEISLLLGVERSATVRAVSESTLIEIAKEALAPVLAARPSLVTELGLLLAARQATDQERSRRYAREGQAQIDSAARSFAQRIAAFLQRG